jgi:putative transposase
MPDSLELDLLLLTVAKPRKIHPDGIHFQGLRYLDPVLAAHQEQQQPRRMPVQDDAVPLATRRFGFTGRSSPA